jgi:hypothetical protein
MKISVSENFLVESEKSIQCNEICKKRATYLSKKMFEVTKRVRFSHTLHSREDSSVKRYTIGIISLCLSMHRFNPAIFMCYANTIQ